MGDILVIIWLIGLVIGLCIICRIIDERRKKTICEDSVDDLHPEEIIIVEGEVYTRYMDYAQYKSFRKTVRKNKKHKRLGE